MTIRTFMRAPALSLGALSLGALSLGVAFALPAAADVEIQQLTSPAGQDFWLVEEHAIPIVSLEIGFRGGSRLDPAGKAGLAEFTMAMMNEGAGDLDTVAFSNRADDISARLGFDAGRDSVQVSGQFLTETLDEGTELLATALAEPRFDPEPVARVRGQILSGIAQAENDPGEVAGKEWFAQAFPDHPYGTPQEGTRETVAAITAEDLRAAQKALMTAWLRACPRASRSAPTRPARCRRPASTSSSRTCPSRSPCSATRASRATTRTSSRPM
jgi:zinc protease